MEKRFKNNFGVQSDSVPLLEAFIKEAEALGWKPQEIYRLEERKRLYFNGNTKGVSLGEGCFWVCDTFGKSKPIDLPSNWDKALALASEVIEEEVNPFKVGDWVHHKDSKTTYQITEFDEQGWCIGDIPGRGWKHTMLKKATKAQINKITGVLTYSNCKVGDVVILIGNDFNSCNEIGDVGTITQKDDNDCRVECGLGDMSNWSYYRDLRKATPEEIRKNPAPKVIIFAETTFVIRKGKDFAITNRGNVSKKEIEKVLRLFTTKMSICGYDLQIEDVDNIKIAFGCQVDTVGKAKEILAAFDEVNIDLPF